ncbi:hypothetical protein CRENBAI_001128 [Crenichthys baileyi]|uniref:Uncharacterized protein n=1 Tax=Crenichthys baileyi TaxID=28760 RepID=A0AAV9SFL1_9TELE
MQALPLVVSWAVFRKAMTVGLFTKLQHMTLREKTEAETETERGAPCGTLINGQMHHSSHLALGTVMGRQFVQDSLIELSKHTHTYKGTQNYMLWPVSQLPPGPHGPELRTRLCVIKCLKRHLIGIPRQIPISTLALFGDYTVVKGNTCFSMMELYLHICTNTQNNAVYHSVSSFQSARLHSGVLRYTNPDTSQALWKILQTTYVVVCDGKKLLSGTKEPGSLEVGWRQGKDLQHSSPGSGLESGMAVLKTEASIYATHRASAINTADGHCVVCSLC